MPVKYLVWRWQTTFYIINQFFSLKPTLNLQSKSSQWSGHVQRATFSQFKVSWVSPSFTRDSNLVEAEAAARYTAKTRLSNSTSKNWEDTGNLIVLMI
tara:strand:+ start:8560 stop:8853 length:294 start_codon:yes stop_codon:yes gene_type:complete